MNFKDASKCEIPEVGDYIPGPGFFCLPRCQENTDPKSLFHLWALRIIALLLVLASLSREGALFGHENSSRLSPFYRTSSTSGGAWAT